MITARCGIFMLKKHISYVLAMFFNFTPKNKTTMRAQNPHGCWIFIGGDEGDRTPDLVNAIGPHRICCCQSFTNFHIYNCFFSENGDKCYDFE